MDTSNTRQEAIRMLGRYQFRKGDYKKARDAFQRWQPQSWCGTCLMSMRAERKHFLLVCRLHLGEQAAVARELLEEMRTGAIDSESFVLLFRLYREARQGNDLAALLSRNDKVKQLDAVQFLLHVQHATAKKDVADLIRLCRDAEQKVESVWLCRAAADALLSCLDNDMTPVLKALDEQGEGERWLIRILGKNGSPKALEWLTNTARKGVRRRDLDEVIHAIARHGEAGKKALAQLAKDRDSRAGTLAEEQLSAPADVDPLERPWPLPRPGSLPH
jgi:hypothetical protein